jgi:hypothetical protein
MSSHVALHPFLSQSRVLFQWLIKSRNLPAGSRQFLALRSDSLRPYIEEPPAAWVEATAASEEGDP